MSAMDNKNFPVERNQIARIKGYLLAAKSAVAFTNSLSTVLVQIFRILFMAAVDSTVKEAFAGSYFTIRRAFRLFGG